MGGDDDVWFFLQFGMLKVVMLNDVPTIQKALVTNSTIFNDRPTFLGILTGSGRTKGSDILLVVFLFQILVFSFTW